MNYLYFAPNVEGTGLKIGLSASPNTRLCACDGEINFDKTYLFECEDVRSVEDFCHNWFNEYRIKLYDGNGSTEWFDIAIFKVGIKYILRHTELLGIISHSPYYDVFNKKRKTTAGAKGGTARLLSDREFTTFLSLVRNDTNHGMRNELLVAMTYYLYLPPRKIYNLKVTDVIDTDGNVLPKFTHPQLETKIKEYIDVVYKQGTYLFLSQKGDKFSANTLTKAINNLYIRFGYKGCTTRTGILSGYANFNPWMQF